MRLPSLPRLWLMTDERLGGRNPGDALWRAIARLPRGAGIVFRHHATDVAERRAILARVRAVARRRAIVVLGTADGDAAHGLHLSGGATARPRHRIARHAVLTAPVHGRNAIMGAARAGAQLIFLSPVFPTRSHAGAVALGPVRFGLIARRSPVPVVALGGVTGRDVARLRALGAHGVAAVDGWSAGRGLAWPGRTA